MVLKRHGATLLFSALVLVCVFLPSILPSPSVAGTVASVPEESTPFAAAPTDSLLVNPPAVGNSLRVREENAETGTTAWKITNYAAAGEIQAYAGSTTVNTGDTIGFYVSTRVAGDPYRLDVFRMGWYNGLGARLMTSVPGLSGIAQGYYTANTGLVACGRCRYDPSTGLLDANWQPSYRLTVPTSWLSGVYLALLADASGKQTYVPFVVRDDERNSALLLQASFNTYEAYNTWGGKSLYDYNSLGAATVGGGPGAVKVSFNRPFETDFGSGQFLRYEYNLVRWVEEEGYDVSYVTNTDLALNPSLLLGHRAFISAGHDEYWTGEARQAVEQALGQGVDLAFLSGDAIYWQARYEPSADGVPARTLVVYRGKSDPLWTSNPARATARWQDPPVNRPENALTGTIYGGQLDPFVQDWVVVDNSSWLFAGTGLKPGAHVVGLVGKEYDRSAENGAGPPGLQVLSHSPVHYGPSGSINFAESTIYTAPSGAIVFSAGTVTWSWGLDDDSYPLGALHSTPVSPAIQRLTANFLDLFAYGAPEPP